MDFDVDKHVVAKFSGDPTDPNTLEDFSKWSVVWDMILEQLQKLQGYTKQIGYMKLLKTLTGQALKKGRSVLAR